VAGWGVVAWGGRKGQGGGLGLALGRSGSTKEQGAKGIGELQGWASSWLDGAGWRREQEGRQLEAVDGGLYANVVREMTFNAHT
jgi:hypothetical protein